MPVNALQGVSIRDGQTTVSTPCGISHIAMVTADIDSFRTFYEGTIGLETAMVLDAGSDHARQAIVIAGDVMLHVFEVPDYDPAAHGFAPAMFERGRLDHLGFTVPDAEALGQVRDRLVAVGASSGDIRPLGPMLSLRFQDPEGFECEINCVNSAYDPSTVRDADQIIDPNWLERMQHVLHARRESRS